MMAFNQENPPPSTLAAHILRNGISSTQKDPGIREHFNKLLQDFLDNPGVEAGDDKFEENHRFVCWLADATVECRKSDEPFTPNRNIESAAGCLKCIWYTIEKHPEVLQFNGSDCSKNSTSPPLILILTAKVLSVAAREGLNAVWDGLVRLLCQCLSSQLIRPETWGMGVTYARFLDTTLNDLLLSLEDFGRLNHKQTEKFSTSFPPVASLRTIWSPTEQMLTFPPSVHLHMRRPNEALSCVVVLFTAIVNHVFSSGRLSAPFVSTMSPTRLLEYGHRILNNYGRLAKHRCVDRRKVIFCLKNLLEKFFLAENFWMNQQFVDLLARTLCLISPSDSQDVQAHFARFLQDLRSPKSCNFISLAKLLSLEKVIERHKLDLSRYSFAYQSAITQLDQFIKSKRMTRAATAADLTGILQPSVPMDAESHLLVSVTTKRTLENIAAQDPQSPKRLKLVSSDQESECSTDFERITNEVTLLLLGQKSTSLQGLNELNSRFFDDLGEEKLQNLLKIFERVPCAATGSVRHEMSNGQGVLCLICDGQQTHQVQDFRMVSSLMDDMKSFYRALSLLCNLQSVRNSRRLRTLFARIVRRFVMHASDSSYLALSSDALGEWSMKCIQSSSRELRMAASHALMSFLREDIRTDIRDKNRSSFLEFLRLLNTRDGLAQKDSRLLTWAVIGRTCGDVELNIALIELVNALGHPHTVVCGTAYHELRHMAKHFGRRTMGLLSPFWSSIAPEVAKNLLTCPQRVQNLADVLELRKGVDEFLFLTQSDTVPFLVLTKRHDILRRVAQARPGGGTIEELFTDSPRNLSNVLARLLLESGNSPQHAMALLQQSAPKLRTPFSEMVEMEALMISCEILKAAGDWPESRRQKAYEAFHLLAMLVQEASGHANPKANNSPTPAFVDDYGLGIMTYFTHITDNIKGQVTLSEKRRAVRAIEQFITIAGVHVDLVLAQVRATLQSAIENKGLVQESFSAWASLIYAMGKDRPKELIQHTFAIVAQKWEYFEKDTQLKAQKLIQHIIEHHNTIIPEYAAMMPSLQGVELLDKIDREIQKVKNNVSTESFLQAFALRCKDDSIIVVRQGLQELTQFLSEHQKEIHESGNDQEMMPAISDLYRSLLDTSIRFKEHDTEIVDFCARNLGILGCVDPNRLESVRQNRQMLVLSNFENPSEVVDFVAHMLENVLVEAFRLATTGKQQSYLAYVMQELLRISGITDAVLHRSRGSPPKAPLVRWQGFPESTQSILTPFLSSKYKLNNPDPPSDLLPFPESGPALDHASWLRNFVFQFLHRSKGNNTKEIFPVISRVIMWHDLSISSFMIPFVIQNIVVDGTDVEMDFIKSEMQAIIEFDIENLNESDASNIKQCSETVFKVLDYLSRWVQEKNSLIAQYASRNVRALPHGYDQVAQTLQTSRVEQILHAISPEKLARRAAECGSYARSVFHVEEHMRRLRKRKTDLQFQFRQLQYIYEQINEPDAIEGISTQLRGLDLSQQVLDHRRSGRFNAALSFYELSVQESPKDLRYQSELLSCLKSAGRFDSMISTAKSLTLANPESASIALSFTTEASWITGRWDDLKETINNPVALRSQDFNVGLGKALLAIDRVDERAFQTILKRLRRSVCQILTPSSTSSLSAAHSVLLKLHVLHEMEALSGLGTGNLSVNKVLPPLQGRLDILGSSTEDKQFVLGIRRAVMSLSKLEFEKEEIASAWLASARLARKANQIESAQDFAMRAAVLGSPAAKLEQCRLLWQGGFPQKAIQTLKGTLEDKSFEIISHSVKSISVVTQAPENLLLAKTKLKLVKWIDLSGTQKTTAIRAQYADVAKICSRSDKGHYYLGCYYNKLLDSDKKKSEDERSSSVLSGDTAKLVIDNYLRSMMYGPKYLYRTVPKVFTLWLDFGHDLVGRREKVKRSSKRRQDDYDELLTLKERTLKGMHTQIKKYMLDRIPPYVIYTAFAQMLSRIDHPEPEVAQLLNKIIARIACRHPRQALWSLLSVSRSNSQEKKQMATSVVSVMKNTRSSAYDLGAIVFSGELITNLLLGVCIKQVDAKGYVSLLRDIGFRKSLEFSYDLVVPIQKTLLATLPSVADGMHVRKNNPFPHEGITIAGFLEEVLVLSSIQKPKKLIMRGSDGEKYPILCKPKDDLRKDQRLMEFNSMIDRALKRDMDASKRRLYIQTYAVTTLNDEHGVLEWIDGLKPLRDIIVGYLNKDGIRINYAELRTILDNACAMDDWDAAGEIFAKQILPKFPPVLYRWFTETYPEPDAWYHARLRYTRSCAVTSIVGNALGLGDRHGENITVEQSAGGLFHVDFNCLFEKGLTFEKPEKVPFRLTHNMVDAFGMYGYEGPFRVAAEITQRTLKQYEETLMTIMESFIYDPTTDFGLERRRRVVGVPDTPKEVLESVKNKLHCMVHGEAAPLGVEGYVDMLIQQATDPRNLVQMYVGWCAYL